jgi:hypothetical protein
VFADINALLPATTLHSTALEPSLSCELLNLFQVLLLPVIATSVFVQDHTSEQSNAVVRIIAFSIAFFRFVNDFFFTGSDPNAECTTCNYASVSLNSRNFSSIWQPVTTLLPSDIAGRTLGNEIAPKGQLNRSTTNETYIQWMILIVVSGIFCDSGRRTGTGTPVACGSCLQGHVTSVRVFRLIFFYGDPPGPMSLSLPSQIS